MFDYEFFKDFKIERRSNTKPIRRVILPGENHKSTQGQTSKINHRNIGEQLTKKNNDKLCLNGLRNEFIKALKHMKILDYDSELNEEVNLYNLLSEFMPDSNKLDVDKYFEYMIKSAVNLFTEERFERYNEPNSSKDTIENDYRNITISGSESNQVIPYIRKDFLVALRELLNNNFSTFTTSYLAKNMSELNDSTNLSEDDVFNLVSAIENKIGDIPL